MARDPQIRNSRRLLEDGFALFSAVVYSAQVKRLIEAIAERAGKRVARRGSDYAARNLLRDVPVVASVAKSDAMMSIARSAVAENAFPVRGILFDKVCEANWHVGWHQDTMIPVAEREDVKGFGPWSLKAGIVHVKPPADVLGRMIALRVHLDDCGPDNGPLRVLPGSHRHGILSSEQVKEWIEMHNPVTCTACRGDVLAMRPLLLHASSRAASPRHRRVIHIEYAAADLPGGLRWGVA
jgi:ectoine hydroxylase-related dioxygenase (phytanoyl-CoA dioxygenase family)